MTQFIILAIAVSLCFWAAGIQNKRDERKNQPRDRKGRWTDKEVERIVYYGDLIKEINGR